jgi:hypothetical protein
MFKIKKQDRDEIVNYLNNVTVPAFIGANLKTIADILSKLEEVEEAKKE